LLAYVVRERGARDARRALAAAVAVVAAVFLPFAALAPGGLKASLQEQATRGLQIESLGGSLLGVAHRLGAGYRVVVSQAPFSFDIGGGTAKALGGVLRLPVVAAAAAALFALLRRGPG